MSDAARIRETVERVVAEVFTREFPRVQAQIVQRVIQELQPLLAASAEASATERLKGALGAIQSAPAQTDILRALLDGASVFGGRVALFIVRGNSALGWQGRGFRDGDAIRLLALDLNSGLSGRAYQQRGAVSGPVAQFEPRFMAGFGAPIDGGCFVFPLLVRDRVTALLYADAGTQPGGKCDVSAMELLVRSASLWIELLALRKAGATPVSAPPPTGVPGPSLGTSPAVPTSAAAAASAGSPLPRPAADSVTTVVVQAHPGEPEQTDAESDLHRKAQRFAKLLVEEIRLYNQAKVAQGKLNRDLYDRLKDDIEKSRATYAKRYSQTSAAASDYFNRELVRILADNDPGLLGINFPR